MIATKKLGLVDRVFLMGESPEAMMHVAVMMPMSPPKNAPQDFFRKLMDECRATADACAPWNLKLRYPTMLKHPRQGWVEDREFDVDYHVRRSALPSPGGERELGVLVSRLHSHQMDFHRPLWEVHFIEGLERGRIAFYFKMHHALIDGYTGIKILERSFSKDPNDLHKPLFFTVPQPASAQREAEHTPTLDAIFRMAREQLGITRQLRDARANLKQAARGEKLHLISAKNAPKSVLNRRISRSRRLATQVFHLERFKRLGRAHGGTLNDIVLAVCSGGLRRYLGERDELPEKSLTAFLPVNVRPKDDPGGGNAVGAMLASLATDIADPLERLRAIIESTAAAKAQLQGMSRNTIIQYSAMLLAPVMLSSLPAMAGRIRPAFNLCISNVPGPREPLYFRGWRMEASFPLSIPLHGYGLNITVASYADTLSFGFIGCRELLPHLQRLAVYSGDALEELEALSLQ